VTQIAIKKIIVEREERRPVELVQQRDHFFIGHTLPPNVSANLSKTATAFAEQASLTLWNVFIQDVHAGCDS
jgi:hypothetical protein